MSEDRQLRAVHAIRVDNPRLRKIDVFVLRFLAREDVVLVELPS